MKKIIIAISFIVLFLPLIIIGILDYKLFEYGITYKNRVIDLKASNITFKDILYEKDDFKICSCKVVVKFDLFNPGNFQIFFNRIVDKKNNIHANNVHAEIKNFYKTCKLTLKKVDIKNYGVIFSDIDINKNYSEYSGKMHLLKPVYITKIANLKDNFVYDVFLKGENVIKTNKPINFSLDTSGFSVFELNGSDVKCGKVDLRKITIALTGLNDHSFRVKSKFILNPKSHFNINGTLTHINPLSGKFKVIINDVKLFDLIFEKTYKKNKIYNTISKFFNINIDNMIKSFDFSVEKGKFKVNL